MDHYLDYHLVPDEALTEPALMSALFTRLHLTLVEEQRNDVGVSFPKAGENLGSVMRLHGNQAVLSAIANSPGLQKLRDYHLATSVKPIPDEYEWCRVKRRQPAMSWAKARRMVKRGTLQPEEAEALCKRRGILTDPYLNLKSQSTGEFFRLYIVQEPVDTAPVGATSFNRYGLGGVVPWF